MPSNSRRILVVGNRGEARRVPLHSEGRSLDLEVPADSTLTVVWNDA